MANVSDHAETSSSTSGALIPPLANMRLTQEQLAAAERTREYHVRKLESQMSAFTDLDSEPAAHREH